MDHQRFAQAVMAAEGSLYRVAKSILHNDEDCADAIQNAVLKAYQKLNTLRNDQYFKTWLTRIVINECYLIIRHAQRYVSLEDYPGWDADAVETAEADLMTEESEIMLELMKLDEKYRLPIVLHEIEGYSAREIGKIMGITEANVRNRLYRGKAMLRQRLKGVM